MPPLPKSFEEAARHHCAVEEELERVCSSTHFRSSRRSCEFLQYVVRVTLDGRIDSLKERSIGIDLFGRDSSYEPSSDATVRVRANEVRKRLTSYYSSPERQKPVSAEHPALRIDLPTGSYVPRFLPIFPAASHPVALPVLESLTTERSFAATAEPPALAPPVVPSVPPIHALTLMRPALLALLVCTLLLRHQLENRENYLRFWDHLLSGRNALVLSLAPQDRVSLASSLYPLVWVAGRYGVDAAMQGDSLTGSRPESQVSVQVSYETPPAAVADSRLRWALVSAGDRPASDSRQSLRRAETLVDHMPGQQSSGEEGDQPHLPLSSIALLTILPGDKPTLQIQGTDADAIRHLLEELTVERNFPASVVERLDGRSAIQILVFSNSTGEWGRSIFLGGHNG
ncbi:MAG TPA: hypothetical protein VIM62_08080 [Acidobacteriaceae bacterium]